MRVNKKPIGDMGEGYTHTGAFDIAIDSSERVGRHMNHGFNACFIRNVNVYGLGLEFGVLRNLLALLSSLKGTLIVNVSDHKSLGTRFSKSHSCFFANPSCRL